MADQENRGNSEDRKEKAPPTASYDGALMGPGAQIGQFRVEREIGRGAMGVVYLAHDSKLKRKVAIKSLPAEVMANTKARTRFTREARTLASLNHPNIATIYDEHEETEGIVHLILEYIPGKTLAERITKGALNLQESLSIALQIAEAVSAAHDHGVIHRDLKPGNIMITSDGKVKVLDFGLAKPVGSEGANQQSTITEPGRIMGTPAYMSPEQARGQATDKRSDIWSFGCILYEMLTAQVPFRGETISDTLANVLQTEPDLEKLPASTPQSIRVLIKRCMEKDLHRRLRDLGDAALEIRDTINLPLMISPAVRSSQDRASSKRSLNWNMIAAWGAVALLVLVLIWQGTKDDTQPVQAVYSHLIPEKDALFEPIGNVSLRWGQPALCISPDGKTVVYVAKVGAETKLYKRTIDNPSFDNEPLDGTEGAFCPFFSPHGDWVGFFTKTELRKVSINNGNIVPITEVETPRGADWGTDGRILLSLKQGMALSIVDEDGGKPRRIPTEGNLSPNHNCPEILPDGKTALVADIFRGILAINLETGAVKTIRGNGTNPKYLNNGHLLFSKNGVLHVVKFDLRKLEPIGKEKPANIDARVESPMGCVQIDISQNGTVVYSPGKSLLQSNFVWVSRTGEEQMLDIERKHFGHFVLSPDGKKLAVQVYRRKPEIWIYDLDSKPPTSYTIGEGWGHLWLNNSDALVYRSDSNDGCSLLKRSISGAEEPEVLFTEKEFFIPGCISLDDKYLIYTLDSNLYYRDIESGQDRVPLLERDDALDWVCSLSRDGKHLALFSDIMGQLQLYVTPFPDIKDIPISRNGADPAVWSKNSNELFFRNDAEFYQVSYETEPSLKFDDPAPLFTGDYLNISGYEFDVSADGEKFLLLKSVDEDFDPRRLNIITNWFEEFK